MTWINSITGGTYNFVAPPADNDDVPVKEVQFPVFTVKEVTLASNAAAVTATDTETLFDLGNTALAAKPTLTVTAGLPVGGKIYVKCVCGATKYDVDIVVGETTITMVNTASKTNIGTFLWDGSGFNQL